MEQIVKMSNYTTPNGSSVSNDKSDLNMGFLKYPNQPKKSPGGENGPITAEVLDVFLYGKRKIQGIDLDRAKRQKTGNGKGSERCQKKHAGQCDSQKSIRQVIGDAIHDIKLTYAVLSFPSEVQLCTSSIPGYCYGVAAKLPFPIGTWIGPYEGKRVKADDEARKSDSNYVWEIYEDGKFSHYLDGNDESNSSWMRFIRCARHKGEQNMVVFQYGNNIYYRAVRDIPAGTELLVWYNNNYTQFLGVPLGLRNVPGSKNEQTKTKSAQAGPVPQAEVKPVLKEVDKNISQTENHGKKAANVYQKQKTPTTSVTYSYTASKPALQPIPHMNGTAGKNLNEVQPTITIEHRPPLPSVVIPLDYKLSPGNDLRQQYIPSFNGRSPPSGSNQNDINNNFFTFSPTFSTPSTSSSSILMACKDRVSPRDNRSPRQSHTSPHEDPEYLKHAEKPYQCGHCSDSFAHPSELSAHVVTHSNDKPFKCGFCGRSFAGANTLNNHMRTHTGNRSFLCNKCGSTLSTASQLSRHMRTPGECPMGGNLNEFPRDEAPSYTSTLTRG